MFRNIFTGTFNKIGIRSCFTSSIRFTETHEWVKKLESNKVALGITDHAQKQLGDIVFVELPDVNNTLKKGDDVATIESTKACETIFTPISGTVESINLKLDSEPGLINKSAENNGWICTLTDYSEDEYNSLMTEEDYRKLDD